jgi:hypothetical protein
MIRFLAAAALAVAGLPCAAQTYPSKPVLKRMRDIVQRAKIQAE